MSAPLVVRFNNPDEFLGELRQRRPNVEALVRITVEHRRRDAVPLTLLSVVATYLHRPVADLGHVNLVELRVPLGELWTAPEVRGQELEPDRAVRARATELVERIGATCRELQLEVAEGRYLETGRT